MKNIRYVFFNGTLREGGAERVISILTNKMVEYGKDVSVLLYHKDPVFYDMNSQIKITKVCEATNSKNIIKNLLYIRQYFKNEADIVISFLAPFNIIALVAHLGLINPIIVADRNDPRKIPSNFPIRKLRDFMYHFADGIVVQTKYNQEYFSRSIRKKSKVIYNPIDLRDNQGLALRTEKKKEIVSVGRLMKQKNQTMLIDAFATIHKEFPDYHLIIYGEGGYRNTLEKKIKDLNLQDVIFLPGNTKDVHEKIASAELFVLSSDYEGMPNALIEAMCLGLPCISTKVSGATDLIKHCKNGSLINIGDKEALVNEIRGLLNDSKRRNFYGQESIKLNEVLQCDIIMKEWTDYFHKF